MLVSSQAHDYLTSFQIEFPWNSFCDILTFWYSYLSDFRTDVPNIDCVLLARPTKSRNLLVQMIGRGMRLHPGKVNCHIIDMVASLATGIVTTPTLFGLDPSELVENANMEELKSLQDRKEVEKRRQEGLGGVLASTSSSGFASPQNVTFTDYDSVFDLIEDTSGERHIRAISPHSWVEVAQDRYILSSSSGAFLNLEKATDESKQETVYIVRETKPLMGAGAKVPFMAPREIARSEKFVDAVHAADTYAKEKYPFRFISRRQHWREEPATEGQLAFLNKLRLREDAFTTKTLSKGRAGDMITKIKHGARGRFARVEAKKRREGRARLKSEQELALREREQVKVGPLSYQDVD
jgi:ATP-dependent helicase IRC3